MCSVALMDSTKTDNNPVERNVNMFIHTTILKWHYKSGCEFECLQCSDCHWSPPAPSLFILKTAEPLYTRGFYSWLTWLIALASDWRRMRQRQPLRESMWEMVLNPVICYQGDRWKHMHCCVSLWTKIVLVQGPSMPHTRKMMNTNSFLQISSFTHWLYN